MPESSGPLFGSPQLALRGRGARPRAALLFWLRGGNAAPRPEGGELSPSVWISLLAIATSSIRTKMRPPWTMARPPASRPLLPPPDRSQNLPRSSVARWQGTPPPSPPRSLTVPPGGQAGAPGRRRPFSPPGLMPHAGPGRETQPPGGARGLPPRTSPRDCVGGWRALSSTNSSFFQG